MKAAPPFRFATRAKWPSVLVLTASEVMALSLWFSASAVVPSLQEQFGISDWQSSLFSSAVGFGFVLGTLPSLLMSLFAR